MSTNGTNTGTLLEIKGVVVDAVFPDELPEIYSALRIRRPDAIPLSLPVELPPLRHRTPCRALHEH